MLPASNRPMRSPFDPGSRPYRMAHDLGQGLHELLARHPWAAERWFELLGLLRHAPAGRYKDRIGNSVAAVRWPELKLPPRRVTLGNETSVLLRPHPGEPDFAALMSPLLDYEASVFRWLEPRLADYDTVIEIGANIGLFTVFMCARKRLARSATPRILSFEPSRLAFVRLLDNLALNTGDAEAFNCAVGERAGIAELHEPVGHLTNGSFDRRFATTFSSEVHAHPVLVVAAEQIARLAGEPGRTLLKIDVEGAEPQVLAGLRPWLSVRRPDVILEVLPEVEPELRKRDYLAALGYRFHRFEHEGPVPVAPYAASPSHRDHLLLAG